MTRWLQQFDSPVFAAFAAAVSWFGFAPQNLVMPVVLAAPFAARRLWVEALLVLNSQSASLVTVIIEGIVQRSRPSPALVGVLAPLTDPSFPGGQLCNTPRFSAWRGSSSTCSPAVCRRTVALVLLAIPIVLVGPSRLYLGRHWLSDLLGVYEVGVGCHTTSIQAFGVCPRMGRPSVDERRWPIYCTKSRYQP